MLRLSWLLLCFSLGIVVACSSDTPPPPQCTGTSCACPSGTSCDITDSQCGSGSCSLSCGNMNTCTGSCGESCSVSCTNQSTCSLSVGASGSVSCASGSTCHITCEGSCSLSCGAGATCDLKCPGDAAAHAVVEGGQCP